MASNDTFTIAHPTALAREGGPAQYPAGLPAGDPQKVALQGVPLKKLASDGYQFQGAISQNNTPLSTGVTFVIALVDDVNNPGPGGVIQLGVSLKRLAAGNDATLTGSGMGAEVLATVPMPATPGQVALATVAVPMAQLGGLAAGDFYLGRVRRLGTVAADTHPGSVLILGIRLKDT